MNYFKVSPDLARKLANPHLTPGPDAVTLKGDAKRWQEVLVVEDAVFEKDGDHEQLRWQFRIPADSETVNPGRSVSEFQNFYWEAIEKGIPMNRVQQTTISYQSFDRLVRALGLKGVESPGDVRAEEVRGQKIQASITLETDKEGILRQRVGNWKAA